MNRRQVLKSCLGVAIAPSFIYNNVWANESRQNPNEISEYFSVTVNGIAVVVNYAAASYSFANIDVDTPIEIVVTALKPDFWKDGVEILPSRHGIRPAGEGNSIRFTIQHAMKIAVSRPGDYYGRAPLLFLFANTSHSIIPAKSKKGFRYYAPGIYHEHIHVNSNETVYLDKGAMVYGSLNFWDATNAHVSGPGVVIHDGGQNPNTDEGWQHRPNWHGLTAHDAHNISVKEITIVVRSRTWMIQLQGCRDVLFENIKVIGGTPNNANQDGIDWLGCGDTLVRDCFFRCSDDIFAIYGNTGFYDDNVSIPGLDVKNILIENCVLSTSISNVMRVGWPRKVFNSRNVVLRNCDVIHAGQGGCVVPFALAEFWADPDGKGVHSDYVFEDIRMDNVYSITQLLQPKNGLAAVKNIRFKNIRLATPPLVDSAVTDGCSEISFENIKLCDYTVDRLSLLGIDNASLSTKIIKTTSPKADFKYDTGLLKAGQLITFNAQSTISTKPIRLYEWNFGDGHFAKGAVVRHVFNDLHGTNRDDTGRFKLQLTITDEDGIQDVIVKPLVIGTALQQASKLDFKQNGLSYRQYTGVQQNWAELANKNPYKTGVTDAIREVALSFNGAYTLWLDGYLNVPVSGGYTFHMMARDGAYLELNSIILVNSNSTQAQVCNTVGNVVQKHTCVSILEAGLHKIFFGYKQNFGSEVFALYWQGPSNKLEPIPMNSFFKSN